MKKKLLLTLLTAFFVPILSGAIVWFGFPEVLLSFLSNVNRMSGGFVENSATVGTLKWQYLKRGKDGEVVLFLHDLGFSKETYIDFAAGLPFKYQVILIDLPGVGPYPPQSDDDFGVLAQKDRIKTFIDHYKIEKIHLVGHGYGANIAFAFAAVYPLQTRSLFLMAPMGFSADGDGHLDRLQRKTDILSQSPLLYTHTNGFDDFLSLEYHHPPQIAGIFKRLVIKRHRKNSVIRKKMLTDALDPSFHATLINRDWVKTQIPVQLVWGTADRLNDAHAVQYFRNAIPQLQVALFEDCGHLPYLEKQFETLKAYLDFLRKQGRVQKG